MLAHTCLTSQVRSAGQTLTWWQRCICHPDPLVTKPGVSGTDLLCCSLQLASGEVDEQLCSPHVAPTQPSELVPAADYGCKPKNTFLGVSPIELKGNYFCVDTNKIALHILYLGDSFYNISSTMSLLGRLQSNFILILVPRYSATGTPDWNNNSFKQVYGILLCLDKSLILLQNQNFTNIPIIKATWKCVNLAISCLCFLSWFCYT